MERTRRSIPFHNGADTPLHTISQWSGHAAPYHFTMERTRRSISIPGRPFGVVDDDDFDCALRRLELYSKLLAERLRKR
jgi:hypothetical protein